MISYIVDDDLDKEYSLEELCDYIYSVCSKKLYSLEECIDFLKEKGRKIYTIS